MKLRLALLFLIMLWSCSTTNYTRTSATLYSNDQEWPVKIKDGLFSAKTITIGPFITTSRKNGIITATFIKDSQHAFNFYVNGKGEHLLVQTMRAARIAFSNRTLPPYLYDVPAIEPLDYTLINGVKNDPLKCWEMILKSPHYLELNNNKPTGILRSTGTDIRVTAHNHFGKVNSYENICYEFHYRGQSVAAIISGDQPRVWVNKKADTTMVATLAAAMTALLLR